MNTLALSLPTPRLFSADLLKLRKRRGLLVVTGLLTIGTVLIANAVSETLHLVDPEPVTAAELFDMLAEEYAGRSTAYRLPPKLVAGSLRVPAVKKLFSGAPPQSIRYLNHPVRFDTRAARELLEPKGVRCPRLDEYVGPLVDFYRKHEDDESYEPG